MGYSYINFFVSLSGNSYISTSSGLYQLIFSSLWVILFCFFAWLVIFYLTPDIINFMFLGAGYFCIPVSILKVCSGIKLHYLEMVWSLQVLLLRFIRWEQSVFTLGLTSSPTEPRTFWKLYPLLHKLWGFSVWLMGIDYDPALSNEWLLFLLIILGGSFLGLK